MNEQNLFSGFIIHRFLERFQSVTYRGVPVARYLDYPFYLYSLNHWSSNSAKEYFPYIEEELDQVSDVTLYYWLDEPYPYDPHPGGTVLMRGGFGDIASIHLPRERIFLLSPDQAEAELIKFNRPDLIPHNIQSYYRENPRAVNKLTQQITKIVKSRKGDPIFGSADLLNWLKDKIPETVRVIDAVQLLFETFNIGAVLTISSIVWMDNALNLVARANRVPSATLQHGIVSDSGLFCNIPIVATKKLVWGKAFRAWYQQYGFPKSRFSIIGSPRFDVIFNREWWNRDKLCQMAEIDSAKKIMVYATGTERNIIVPLILNGLAPISDLFLLILMHPSETSLIEQYQQLTAGYSNRKVLPFGNISLYNALSGADFFITHCSTAAFEAMLFRLPVITVEPTTPLHFSYGELGASLRVTDSAELTQTVKRLMSDESFREAAVNQYHDFLADYCIPDGDSSKRLFEEIEKLCQNGGIA
ncbi:CDP-glycerol:poly(glycerophosphate) glycerophosphotransferase [Hydrogenispora ethanolica]|uniref:CDP-glycerol:poly(Glycerophosphate) glycerophosphotransferase n=1 Tax=Hydrogenispora ethanolica TaxID=1082276 RepID=A0A4R1RC81_HYDET|nr:CDP-glycerol glycerophosphotransferase family protein [Hydrogenispora ethanolica]TCL63359.1 CDP-glycerol:poly(glycerophosphate) glycerophosphotransferase [Hydrogenispora ethanolica]